MTRLRLVIIALFVTVSSYAQKVAVSSLKQNVVELGIVNPLQIMAEGANCNQLVVSTDNGSIRRTGPCQYDYTPSRVGLAQIIIYGNGPKSGTNYLLRVVQGEAPLTTGGASIGGKNSGFITKGMLQAQQGLLLRSTSGPCQVKGYQIAIVRGAEIIFKRYTKGNKFVNEIYEALAKSQNGDLLLVFDIYGIDKKGDAFAVDPIQLTIR